MFNHEHMNNLAFNPYLPSFEYIPDAEPHVFGDRVYIYGSHDKFNGISFSLNDYVCWSAPLNDLSAWRFEGTIFKRLSDPNGRRRILRALYAPDVCQGNDGRFYLYYFVGYTSLISVAVCDSPCGEFKFIGHVKYKDGSLLGSKGEPLQFDPGVFVDEDGRTYLYTGFGPVNYPSFLLNGHKPSPKGAMGFELEDDMLTIKTGPVFIGVEGKISGKGTPYEGHEFFEAISLRKFADKYYFIYSSFEGHELCYAVSDNPLGGFAFGGVLVSNGDVGIDGRKKEEAINYLGNTHGSLVNLNGQYYVFYHRQTNKHQFSRQACAEKITFENGKFVQAEMTSCGLNDGPLPGIGKYEARIACNLYSKEGAYWYGVIKRIKKLHPYFTQHGKDREDNPDQYIANFRDGAVAGFKYFSFEQTQKIRVQINSKANGVLKVFYDLNKAPVAEIKINHSKGIGEFCADFHGDRGIYPLYFKFEGKGKFVFVSFSLE